MATSVSHLSLNDDGDEYRVSPVVILSILDAHKRRPISQEEDKADSRAVGVLLGERTGNKVYISEAFPVPHVEDAESVQFNNPFCEAMLALHKRLRPALEPVGWFTTGTGKINWNSVLLHQEFLERVPKPHQAVLLSVNTALAHSRLGISAFRAKVVKLGGKDVQMRFQPAPVELQVSEAEKIGRTWIFSLLPPAAAP